MLYTLSLQPPPKRNLTKKKSKGEKNHAFLDNDVISILYFPYFIIISSCLMAGLAQPLAFIKQSTIIKAARLFSMYLSTDIYAYKCVQG